MATNKTKAVQRVDILRIDKDPVIEADEGFAHIPAAFTRTGVFPYRNADGSTRMELRHPDDVMDAESVASLKRRPVVIGHPSFGSVTKDNARSVSVGFTGDDVEAKKETLNGVVTLIDGNAIDMVMRKESPVREISCGYNAILTDESGFYEGKKYDSRQRKIRYNHVAIVDNGRMGSQTSFKIDSDSAVMVHDSLDVEIEFTQKDTRGQEPMKTKFKQPSRTLKDFKLDSADIEVEVGSEAAIQQMILREDALVAYAESLEGRVDKAEGERDGFKKELETATKRADEAEKRPKVEDIAALVADRAKLIEDAKSCKVEVKDEDDNRAIKVNVLAKVSGEKAEALADRSDDYIDARYDSTTLDVNRAQEGMKRLADAGGLGSNGASPPAKKPSKRELYLDDKFGRTSDNGDDAGQSASK